MGDCAALESRSQPLHDPVGRSNPGSSTAVNGCSTGTVFTQNRGYYPLFESFCLCSVFNAIAQMKPSSSRPSAVTIWFLFLPRAANVLYRLCSRYCAFHAICFTSSLNASDFCLLSRNPVTLGRC